MFLIQMHSHHASFDAGDIYSPPKIDSVKACSTAAQTAEHWQLQRSTFSNDSQQWFHHKEVLSLITASLCSPVMINLATNTWMLCSIKLWHQNVCFSICFFKVRISLKEALQFLHGKRRIPVWIRMCIPREQPRVKAALHSLHENGFSPVCFRMCSLRSANRWYVALQSLHTNWRIKTFTWLCFKDMCFFKLVAWVKVCWQCPQENGFSPVCLIMCLFKSLDRTKAASHILHECGFSPAWPRMCTFIWFFCLKVAGHCGQEKGLLWECFWTLWCLRWPDCLKAAPHWSHENGLSPVCLRRCIWKCPEVVNDAPQSLHRNGLCPVWRRMCTLKLVTWLNAALQTWHVFFASLLPTFWVWACVTVLLVPEAVSCVKTLSITVPFGLNTVVPRVCPACRVVGSFKSSRFVDDVIWHCELLPWLLCFLLCNRPLLDSVMLVALTLHAKGFSALCFVPCLSTFSGFDNFMSYFLCSCSLCLVWFGRCDMERLNCVCLVSESLSELDFWRGVNLRSGSLQECGFWCCLNFMSLFSLEYSFFCWVNREPLVQLSVLVRHATYD